MGAKRVEIRISNDSTFGAGTNDDEQLYFPKTIIDQVVGLLNSDTGKINLGLMPSFMFGGQKYFDTINADTTFGALLDRLIIGRGEIEVTDISKLAGHYFQATDNLTITNNGPITVTAEGDAALYQMLGNKAGEMRFQCEPDDGQYAGETIKVEANDYIVFSGFTETEYGALVKFGIINNTYGDANTSEKGVVTLAKDTDITTGTNTTTAVTPAGAKLAVTTFAPKHPIIGTTIDDFGLDSQQDTPRIITSITLSTDHNHINSIGTEALPKANFAQYGLIKNVGVDESKTTDLTKYNIGYAVSAEVAKQMIDYWGKIDYFATLAEANNSPVKNVSGKMVLVGV